MISNIPPDLDSETCNKSPFQFNLTLVAASIKRPLTPTELNIASLSAASALLGLATAVKKQSPNAVLLLTEAIDYLNKNPICPPAS